MRQLEADYKTILKRAAVLLAGHGLRRAGATFYCRRDDNWGLVSFQRHSKNSAGDLDFTINVGVASQRLLTFYEPHRRSGVRPRIDECHWQPRIGLLMGLHEDKWWNLPVMAPEVVSEEVAHALERYAIPALQAHLTDEDLMNAWQRAEYENLTRERMLMHRSVLECFLTPQSLAGTLAELVLLAKPESFRRRVDEHIQKLRAICGDNVPPIKLEESQDVV